MSKFGNAILTDNLVWRFWHGGEYKSYAGLELIELVDDKLVLKEEEIDLFFSLLQDFIQENPAQIKSSNKLAKYMAIHAGTIRSVVIGILRDDGTGQPDCSEKQKKIPMFPELYGLYKRIRQDLQPQMNTVGFADMYAQYTLLTA